MYDDLRIISENDFFNKTLESVFVYVFVKYLLSFEFFGLIKAFTLNRYGAERYFEKLGIFAFFGRNKLYQIFFFDSFHSYFLSSLCAFGVQARL